MGLKSYGQIRDVDGGGLPEQAGFDAVVDAHQNVAQPDKSGPVDARTLTASLRRQRPAGLADDLHEAFGDQSQVLSGNPLLEGQL